MFFQKIVYSAPWIILFVAGLLEVAWITAMKYTEGFTKLWASVFTVFFGILSFFSLSQTLRCIPIGTAYAVWTGIGATGTMIVGIFFFKEPATLPRIICILLIVIGIVGLRLLENSTGN